jgi:riboflavin kinase / FMN adenylyltransferase
VARFDGALTIDPPLAGSVVTLGSFDGLHIGHQSLIRQACEEGRRQGVPAVGYTFHPHPARVLAPRFAPKMLMSLTRRVEGLHGLGLDHVVVEPFDAAFAAVEADAWVRDWVVPRLRPRAIVIGFNFTYGKDRAGNPESLRILGDELGFAVQEVAPVQIGGLAVSSTKVREFVQNGNVEGAEELLGRPFVLAGEVVKGDQRGRQIGLPTANLRPDSEVLPAHGVYATHAVPAGGGDPRPAVTNVGLRPTFAGDQVTVETHLLDFEADLYGQPLELRFRRRIRGEMRFDGPEALVSQVRRDIERARHLLGVEPR